MSKKKKEKSTLQPALEVGCKVEVDGGRTGILRFIGHVHYKTGVYYGIELTDGSLGVNNGTVGQDRYFTCKAKVNQGARWRPGQESGGKKTAPLRGVFVRRFKIRRVLRAPQGVDALKLRKPRSQKKKRNGSGKRGVSPKGVPGHRRQMSVTRPRANSVEAPPKRKKRATKLKQKKPCKICGEDLNFWEPLADQILDHVLLGGFPQSQDGNGLEQSQVTHILNCARELPNCFPDVIKYKKLEWKDNEGQHIIDDLHSCFEFLDEAAETGGVALVHCQQGKSRSVAVVMCYMIARRGLSANVALERVKAIRPISQPNDNFMMQIREFERQAKRWRRNPDPSKKRLYGLQSFKRKGPRHARRGSEDGDQPKSPRKEEREKRMSKEATHSRRSSWTNIHRGESPNEAKAFDFPEDHPLSEGRTSPGSGNDLARRTPAPAPVKKSSAPLSLDPPAPDDDFMGLDPDSSPEPKVQAPPDDLRRSSFHRRASGNPGVNIDSVFTRMRSEQSVHPDSESRSRRLSTNLTGRTQSAPLAKAPPDKPNSRRGSLEVAIEDAPVLNPSPRRRPGERRGSKLVGAGGLEVFKVGSTLLEDTHQPDLQAGRPERRGRRGDGSTVLDQIAVAKAPRRGDGSMILRGNQRLSLDIGLSVDSQQDSDRQLSPHRTLSSDTKRALNFDLNLAKKRKPLSPRSAAREERRARGSQVLRRGASDSTVARRSSARRSSEYHEKLAKYKRMRRKTDLFI